MQLSANDRKLDRAAQKENTIKQKHYFGVNINVSSDLKDVRISLFKKEQTFSD